MGSKPAPKKGGRKPILDPEAVAATLANLRGNVAAVAKHFGVHRSSVQELIDKRPSLRAVLRDAREGMIDNAESSLYAAVIKGEAWAVCFFFKTQGKGRGYVERAQDIPPLDILLGALPPHVATIVRDALAQWQQALWNSDQCKAVAWTRFREMRTGDSERLDTQ